MQYIVRVSGEASSVQTKSYIINSSSETDARIKAVEEFQEDYSILGDSVYAKPKSRTFNACLGMFFMLIPIFLSLIRWRIGRELISIGPDLTSCLYGILIYSAFVVRFKTIQRTVSTWIDIVYAIICVLLLASFVKIITVDKALSIFGHEIFGIKTTVLIPIAVLLTWVGLPVISTICIIVICLLALFKITNLSEAMGMLWGSTYIISAFIGIMLYLSVEPAATEIVASVKKSAQNSLALFKVNSLNVKQNVIKLIDSKNHIKEKQQEGIVMGKNENKEV